MSKCIDLTILVELNHKIKTLFLFSTNLYVVWSQYQIEQHYLKSVLNLLVFSFCHCSYLITLWPFFLSHMTVRALPFVSLNINAIT